MTAGVILFAHGARDPRWAEPFERVRSLVAARLDPSPVRLAFLELMPPTLEDAADAMAADGCTRLTVVPIFLGQGSHVRRDLPERVDALRARLPALSVSIAETAGEDDAVLAAIADYCVRVTAP
jgi:sirohydrochlorin cobaltochelatase